MKPSACFLTILIAGIALPVAAQGAHPDLSGVWQGERTPISEVSRTLGPDFANLQVDINDVGKYYIDVFWGMKPEEEPLRPEAVALLKKRGTQESPTARCLPAGVPGGLFIYAFKMIQTPKEIVLLPESGDPPRQIYLDGRSFPKEIQPSWSGYSIGKWQGDALVVETTGFNEDSWLDGFGHPRSETMRVRETYRRRDARHMDVEVAIEDPKYYTKPFGFKTELDLVPQGDVMEYVCGENEKDLAHMRK